VCREKVKNAIPYVVWGLRFEMHIPVLSARDTFFQVPGTRGGVKVGMAWENERGELEGHQLLWLRAGDGIAIDHRLQAAVLHILLMQIEMAMGRETPLAPPRMAGRSLDHGTP
jgi:hypothetical protein